MFECLKENFRTKKEQRNLKKFFSLDITKSLFINVLKLLDLVPTINKVTRNQV